MEPVSIDTPPAIGTGRCGACWRRRRDDYLHAATETGCETAASLLIDELIVLLARPAAAWTTWPIDADERAAMLSEVAARSTCPAVAELLVQYAREIAAA